MMRGVLTQQEPLAPRTSWRVGGPASKFYRPADADDLAEFVGILPADEPLLWLGLGSNLLVRDGGVPGTTICLQGTVDAIEPMGGTRVRVDAGAHCAKLAKTTAEQGWTGGEFFCGIPGTLGGALAMNAGAWGGETWPMVESVTVILSDGARREIPADQFAIGYRSMTPPADIADAFRGFSEAVLRFSPDTDGGAKNRIKQYLAERRASQPVGKPSCGSVFRNPPGDHAARLIEAAGLKGKSIGGAEVSTKHANFILNTGTATAADIEGLIGAVQTEVAKQFGVRLQPEVRVVGVAA